jgi:exosome complex component RRP4
MRQWFKEGELLVCEVQAFFQDGSISLHTRSLSYGKLRNGQLVKGSPFLVPRLKTHFLSLASGVQLIIGLNGLIWVSTGGETSDVLATDVDPATELYSSKNHEIQPEKREAIARVACCIEALVEAGAMLTETRITAAWEASLEGEEDEATPVQQLAFSTASKLELVQRALAVA